MRIKSGSTFEEAAMLCSHVSTVAQNVALLGIFPKTMDMALCIQKIWVFIRFAICFR